MLRRTNSKIIPIIHDAQLNPSNFYMEGIENKNIEVFFAPDMQIGRYRHRGVLSIDRQAVSCTLNGRLRPVKEQS